MSFNFLYNFLYNKYVVNNENLDFDKYMHDEMIKYFDYQISANNNLNIKQVLSYIVEPQISDIIFEKLRIKDVIISKLSKDNIFKIINCLLDFKIDIISYTDYKSAQLTQGGVDIAEIDDISYESKKIKNLYFTGEIIDVDGICGGYNLQFAFGSGWTVGKILNDKN